MDFLRIPAFAVGYWGGKPVTPCRAKRQLRPIE